MSNGLKKNYNINIIMNICIVEKENNFKKNITEEELDKLLTDELKNKYEFDENEFMANCLFFNGKLYSQAINKNC